MGAQRENGLELDMQLARECILSFSGSTSVGCSLVDCNGDAIFSAGICCETCQFCKKLQAVSGQSFSCYDSHIYGMIQSQQFGGKYIYFCPAGLTCFISPIYAGTYPEAYLIGGQVLMVDKNDYLQYDIVERLQVSGDQLPTLEAMINDIPAIAPERVSNLADTLFHQAGFIGSAEQTKRLLESRESNAIQGQIGEYLKSIKGQETSYPFDKEQELTSAITDGDKALAQHLLNELLGFIFLKSGGDFNSIRARIMELIALISRAAIRGGADQNIIFQLNNRYMSEFHHFRNVDDLCYWLSGIMTRFIDYVFNFENVKHVDIIHKSLDYIRNNYQNKITLEDVAGAVYLSPSYFSKIFKEEMNVNLNTYINHIRIEKSKQLLVSDQVKMIDVAGMVGYEDQSYFSKVFKKVVGVTPGYYREQRGHIRARKDQDITQNI